jgi:hypothetical protein
VLTLSTFDPGKAPCQIPTVQELLNDLPDDGPVEPELLLILLRIDRFELRKVFRNTLV